MIPLQLDPSAICDPELTRAVFGTLTAGGTALLLPIFTARFMSGFLRPNDLTRLTQARPSLTLPSIDISVNFDFDTDDGDTPTPTERVAAAYARGEITDLDLDRELEAAVRAEAYENADDSGGDSRSR